MDAGIMRQWIEFFLGIKLDDGWSLRSGLNMVCSWQNFWEFWTMDGLKRGGEHWKHS
jgi:hypothetical protein